MPSGKRKIRAAIRTKCEAPPKGLPKIVSPDQNPLPVLPAPTRMNVLSVTLLVSLCLTGIFVTAFLFEHLRRRESGPEHDSLLPLDDNDTTRRPAEAPTKP